MLVKSSLELPGFATLDELAARIRQDVNAAMFERSVRSCSVTTGRP